MLIQILLVLFGPSHARITVIAEKRVTTKFADDERLVLGDLPGQAVGLLRQSIVPADIFVAPEHVEVFAKWIINQLRVGVRVMALVRSGQQARRISFPRMINQTFEKLDTRFTDRSLVRYR